MSQHDAQDAHPNDSDAAPSHDDAPDYYVENGCVVFTAAYHRRRGYCCGNQCRHCPYEGDEKRTSPVDGDRRRRA